MNWASLTPKELMDWIIVIGFGLLFIVTVIACMGFIPKMPEGFRKHLFKILICEVVAAGFYIFYHGANQQPNWPDFSGKWQYTCTPTNTQWGGICTFTPKDGGIFIDGDREWELQNGVKTSLSPAVHWETLWASYAEGHLGYHYKVVKTGYEGFAEGNVRLGEDKKTAVEIKGNFWVLPSGPAISGEMEIIRQK